MRNYKRKTDRGTVPQEIIKSAVAAVLVCNLSIRKAAKEFNICVRTLARYIKKAKEQAKPDDILGTPTIPASLHFGYVRMQVFSAEQETYLAAYLKQATDIYNGLPSKEMRKLAVAYGKRLNAKMPTSWLENEVAGADWLSAFLKRQQRWSIKLPDCSNQSISPNMQSFYSNLESIVKRLNIESTDMWSMGEIAVTTAQSRDRVMTRRDSELSEKLTPTDCSSMVAVAVTLSAYGNTIPPFFVSPEGASRGRLAHIKPAVWLNGATFMDFMTHFIKFTRPSKERPVLLLLDFHLSYLSFELLDLVKANGIVMMSYPPRVGDQLQPLERTLIGPLKHYVQRGCDNWMAKNPDKELTIHSIPHILQRALLLACMPHIITLGFDATGIYPLNCEMVSSVGSLPACSSDCMEAECVSDTSQAASSMDQCMLYASDTLNPEMVLKIEEITSSAKEGFSDWIVSQPSSAGRRSPGVEPSCDYASFYERIGSPEDVKPFIQLESRISQERGRKRKVSTTTIEAPRRKAR